VVRAGPAVYSDGKRGHGGHDRPRAGEGRVRGITSAAS
jgi:hypothetical protein